MIETLKGLEIDLELIIHWFSALLPLFSGRGFSKWRFWGLVVVVAGPPVWMVVVVIDLAGGAAPRCEVFWNGEVRGVLDKGELRRLSMNDLS